MFIRQPEGLARCIHIFRAGLSMRFVCAFYFRDSFADERVRDDELGLAVIAPLRYFESIEKLLHVVAIDLLYIKSVCLHAFASVFALRFLRCGVERDGI